MTQVINAVESIFNYDLWSFRLEEDSIRYRNAEPFPHIALDNFLEPWAADKALEVFPKIEDEGWIHWVHVNERKHGLNKLDLLPDFIRKIVHELNSEQFVSYLSRLTGIANLLPDSTFEGGGIHQSQRGGFLNIHADFTVHPHRPKWRRRVNLLLYLNKDWQDEWRGHLEFWSKDMKQCEQKISPIFNRAVIFNTDETSYHGLPEPICCPENETRKSIALYYFTEEKSAPKLHTTNYLARPHDGGLKGVMIYLDKKAIYYYTLLKRKLGLNDDFASNLLNFFGKRK